jgi:hypothetical protein
MLQTKRGADDDPLESLSESSKKIRNCTGGGETLDPLVSGLLHFIFPQMFFTDIMVRSHLCCLISCMFVQLGELHRHSTLAEQNETDSDQSVWSELSEEVTSNLSRNIVSIALRAGDYGVTFFWSFLFLKCLSCSYNASYIGSSYHHIVQDIE